MRCETDLGQWGRIPIAGNLPYYVATAIIEQGGCVCGLSRAVFLIQKEVADRLTAHPGSRGLWVFHRADRPVCGGSNADSP